MFTVYDGHAGEQAGLLVKMGSQNVGHELFVCVTEGQANCFFLRMSGKTLPDILRTHLQEEPDVEHCPPEDGILGLLGCPKRPSSMGDRKLILERVPLASDGSWNPLKDQFAVTHARRALRTTEQPQDAQRRWSKMPRKSAQLTTQLP